MSETKLYLADKSAFCRQDLMSWPDIFGRIQTKVIFVWQKSILSKQNFVWDGRQNLIMFQPEMIFVRQK